MFWKNWPYWLKDGMLVGIIFVFWFFIIYVIEKNTCESPVTCGIGTAVLNLPSVLIVDVLLVRIGFFRILGRIFGPDTSQIMRFAFIPLVNFMIGFLIGSFMGLIYGKFKINFKKNGEGK